MTENPDTALTGGHAPGGTSGPQVPDHALTALVASVAALFDDIDALTGAAEGPSGAGVAAQIDQYVSRIEADLRAVRAGLARYSSGLRGAAGNGPGDGS